MYNLLQSDNELGTVAKKFTNLYSTLEEDLLKNINLSL